jgi:hypothetical protein
VGIKRSLKEGRVLWHSSWDRSFSRFDASHVLNVQLFKVKEENVSCCENDTSSALSIYLFMVYLTTIAVSEATGNDSMKSVVCLLINFSIRHSTDLKQS